MNNVEKEFVPYKEALALKQLGFDEPCFAFFQAEYTELLPTMVDDDEEYRLTGYRTCNNSEMPKHYTSAPTFSQAFRFFRENHNLHYFINVRDGIWFFDRWSFDGYKTYEEAELACLKRLIKIAKEKQ